MSRDLKSIIEEIKHRIDIVDVVGSRLELRKAGKDFKSPCPFHQEKTASFFVSPEKQLWHCFGACHEGGDVIKFLMKYESLTFTEVVKSLAQQLSIDMTNTTIEDGQYDLKKRLIEAHALATNFYQHVLNQTTAGIKVLEYLKERQINDKIIEKFKLGYAPNQWDLLFNFLTKKGFKSDELVTAGLIGLSSQGNYYDRFRGRLMFPICDLQGQVIAFSGRVMTPDAKQAKYINSSETPIYHKRETLFGIHIAKEAIQKQQDVLLVEGEFDMISPYQAGISNVVAIKGSAVTKDQLQILKRLTKRVTLALDADAAGQDALNRTIQAAEHAEIELYVLNYAGGKDPDEAIKSNPGEFKKSLQNAQNVYDHVFNRATQKYNLSNPFDKKYFSDEMIDLMRRIRNPVILSYYAKKLAELLLVSEASIHKQIYRRRQASLQKFTVKHTSQENINQEELLQKYILSRIIQQPQMPDLAQTVFEILDPEDFTVPAYAKLATILKDKIELNKFPLPPELRATYDEVGMYRAEEQISAKALANHAYQLKLIHLKQYQTKLSETDNDTEMSRTMAKIREISSKVNKA